MWVIGIIVGIIIILVSIGLFIWSYYTADDDDGFGFTLCLLGMAVMFCGGLFAGESGYNGFDYHNEIPQQHYELRMLAQSATHYKSVLAISHSDEKAEHHNGPKFTGDLGEPKDNHTQNHDYQQLYQREFAYHNLKILIKYEKHPIKNIGYAFYLHHSAVSHSVSTSNIQHLQND